MLRIIITASGREYQTAAARAACTFAIHARAPSSVLVLLPGSEEASPYLTRRAKEFRFAIEKYPFTVKSSARFTSQLKCQAFAWRIARLGQKEIALFADADTCCLRPIRLPSYVKRGILEGQVGLVPDIADRHFLDPTVPWYLAPKERSVYVNTGIIFASRQALGFFERVQKLSDEPRFLKGPFNDQKVINYALGKHFPGLLVALDRKFNNIGPVCYGTVVAHFAGGAGHLAQHRRSKDHEQMCLKVLNSVKVN